MTTSSHSHPRGAGTGARGKDEAALLQAPAHLTDRDRELVRLVGEHRVLTTGQLTALGFANLTTARHRLSVLVRIGLLRRFRPHPPTGSAPWHYVLGPLAPPCSGSRTGTSASGRRRPEPTGSAAWNAPPGSGVLSTKKDGKVKRLVPPIAPPG
jgi:Replication-relaxation